MRKTILIALATLFVTACGSKLSKNLPVENKGKTVVLDGRNQPDTVEYNCVGCKENLNQKLFTKVKDKATELAALNLRNPLSFKPLFMDIIVGKADSLYYFDTNLKIDSALIVYTKYKYIGQNAYGTELSGEQIISFYIVDDSIQDLTNEIRLDSLKFEDVSTQYRKHINRTLYCRGSNSSDFIEVIPTFDKTLIVKSSLSCVDEGTVFRIELVSGEEIRLTSWNSFNCDPVSYYYFFNQSQIAKLKQSKVKYLYIYSRGDSELLEVPKNQSDYFQQLVNLY